MKLLFFFSLFLMIAWANVILSDQVLIRVKWIKWILMFILMLMIVIIQGSCEAFSRSCGCCRGLIEDEVQREHCESACDFATHVFCHPCAICQEGRELRRRLPHPGFNAQPVLVMIPPAEQSMGRSGVWEYSYLQQPRHIVGVIFLYYQHLSNMLLLWTNAWTKCYCFGRMLEQIWSNFSVFPAVTCVLKFVYNWNKPPSM